MANNSATETARPGPKAGPIPIRPDIPPGEPDVDEEEARLEEDLAAGHDEEQAQYQQDKEEAPILAPLTTPGDSLVANWLTIEPTPIDWVFNNLLPRGTVGAVAASGGVGKTFFMMHLLHSLARGTKFGLFEPTRKFNVLMLAAEDPEEIIAHRLWAISGGKAEFPDNFHVKSVVGQCGPLMKLEGGNPRRTEWYHRLKLTIEAFRDLDVLVIDPKSRWYGLDENSNDHNTQWVQALEELTQLYKLTTLFTHHVPKAKAGSNSTGMFRGGSALEDGIRWAVGLHKMEKSEADEYGIIYKNYVVLDLVKTNYSPEQESRMILKRGVGGILIPCDPTADHYRSMGETLSTLLHNVNESFTKYELSKSDKCKLVRDQMQEKFPVKWKREKIVDAVNAGVRSGHLRLVPRREEGSRQTREVVEVSDRAGSDDDLRTDS
ncbi:MAG: AAA family ATPase [Deltaproteobacteria bacterium]|nr:AAA family ATPase [Deltaproteobacteria bacterium]